MTTTVLSQSFPIPSSDFLSKYQVILPPAISELAKHTVLENKPLGSSYQPGDYDVVCGRGKGSYNRIGNKRFRALVCTYIPEYTASKSKLDKGVVLNCIIEKVRQQDQGRARFVKYDKKNGWYEINEDQAREKVGHAMREAISSMESAASAPEKEISSKGFEDKQTVLLAQQKALFKKMVMAMSA